MLEGAKCKEDISVPHHVESLLRALCSLLSRGTEHGTDVTYMNTLLQRQRCFRMDLPFLARVMSCLENLEDCCLDFGMRVGIRRRETQRQ